MRRRPISSGEISLALVARRKRARLDSSFEIRAIGGRYYYVHRRSGEHRRIVNDVRTDLRPMLEEGAAFEDLRGLL